jgi:hypothetical protein
VLAFRPWLLALAAALVVTSCDGDASPLLGPATCDGAADRLIEVCDPLTGEGFRAECEREGQELFFPDDFQCLANLPVCDEPHLKACGYRSLAPPSCDTARTCDQPWSCDSELDECVRCVEDDDCASGRGCLLGLCFEMGTDFYETLRRVQAASDGGIAPASND